jgi:hypothetical protein
VLIAWRPDQWDWVGFQLERWNDTTQRVTVLVDRIQARSGAQAANWHLVLIDPTLYLH